MKPFPTTKQNKCQLYIYLNEDLKAWCVEQAAQHDPPLSVSQWVAWQLETIKRQLKLKPQKGRVRPRWAG